MAAFNDRKKETDAAERVPPQDNMEREDVSSDPASEPKS
jgi:hypothetical protein